MINKTILRYTPEQRQEIYASIKRQENNYLKRLKKRQTNNQSLARERRINFRVCAWEGSIGLMNTSLGQSYMAGVTLFLNRA